MESIASFAFLENDVVFDIVRYMEGQYPFADLKDVLTHLPTQRASHIGELLLDRWASQ